MASKFSEYTGGAVFIAFLAAGGILAYIGTSLVFEFLGFSSSSERSLVDIFGISNFIGILTVSVITLFGVQRDSEKRLRREIDQQDRRITALYHQIEKLQDKV